MRRPPDNLVSLGRRLVRAPWWPDTHGFIQPSGQGRSSVTGILWIWSDEANWVSGGCGDQVPDLSDFGTAGALLRMMPAVWTIGSTENLFMVSTGDLGVVTIRGQGDFLGEAVALALLDLHGG